MRIIIKRLLVVALVAVTGITVAATPASASFIDFELKNRWYAPSATWPGACLDMDIWGPGNGSKVQLWTCNGEPQQRWYWGRQFHGYAELQNTRTGRCLDIRITELRNGGYTQVWDCYGENQHNQHWRIEQQPGSNPPAFMFVNEAGFCLDADWNGRYFDGKVVQAWQCHPPPNDNQYWRPYLHEHA
jgi:hypothetical protein